MNFYSVELKRVSYVTLQIDAETPEKAEELAWDEILKSGESYWGDDADWTTESISEQFATDETRSYGPQGETLGDNVTEGL